MQRPRTDCLAALAEFTAEAMPLVNAIGIIQWANPPPRESLRYEPEALARHACPRPDRPEGHPRLARDDRSAAGAGLHQKRTGTGTWLGLSTVYGNVRQMGGVVAVERERGCATFSVYAPGRGAHRVRVRRGAAGRPGQNAQDRLRAAVSDGVAAADTSSAQEA